MRRVAVVAILVAGCQGGHKPPAAPGRVSPLVGNGVAPAQFSDLAPGDTAGVIAMMRQTMSTINMQLDSMTRRDTTVTLPGDSVPHRLVVWQQHGEVRKLMVTGVDSTGQNNGETDVWFTGGDVSVIEQVSDFYAFDFGRIVLWTDDAMDPRTDVTSDLVMARETQLMDVVRRWLMVFGVALP